MGIQGNRGILFCFKFKRLFERAAKHTTNHSENLWNITLHKHSNFQGILYAEAATEGVL